MASFNFYFNEQEIADLLFLFEFFDSVAKNCPDFADDSYNIRLKAINERLQNLMSFHFADLDVEVEKWV